MPALIRIVAIPDCSACIGVFQRIGNMLLCRASPAIFAGYCLKIIFASKVN